MNISLDPKLARFVEERVKAGLYDSADDLINAAVARLKTDEEKAAEELADLRVDVDAGLAEADRGDFAEFTAEDVIAERHAARASRHLGT
ncbi:MAG TPA: type II toxin-antitoxin system ParD family antitoxin [Tepidisphaeraceae bacterium]|nr:type II toxin-antitoxin system ParD family antitoxin [Tepidisphaeraceae bacterium]